MQVIAFYISVDRSKTSINNKWYKKNEQAEACFYKKGNCFVT
jgi:hypothetical protein